jgi:hypothetical protein
MDQTLVEHKTAVARGLAFSAPQQLKCEGKPVSVPNATPLRYVRDEAPHSLVLDIPWRWVTGGPSDGPQESEEKSYYPTEESNPGWPVCSCNFTRCAIVAGNNATIYKTFRKQHVMLENRVWNQFPFPLSPPLRKGRVFQYISIILTLRLCWMLPITWHIWYHHHHRQNKPFLSHSLP